MAHRRRLCYDTVGSENARADRCGSPERTGKRSVCNESRRSDIYTEETAIRKGDCLMASHVDPEAWAKKRKRRIIIWVTVSVLVTVCVIAFILLRNRILPALNYAGAELELSAGNRQEAIDRFSLLGDYKDSTARAAEIAYGIDGNETLRDLFSNAVPGDVVSFGRYEQDNRTDNGAEPIQWIVLRKENGRLLLMSVSVLDQQPYHADNGKITWEDCSLRKWLNETFSETAFTDAERAVIAKTKLTNDHNPASYVSGGRDTEDRIFIFSFSELLEYLQGCTFLDGIYAFPSSYAVAQGVERHEWYETACWWLRTPGIDADSAVYCDMAGKPLYSARVGKLGYGVRPSMWILIGE